MQKHKFASVSLTVRDRAILSKFHNEFFTFKDFQGLTSGFSKDLLPSQNFQSGHLQSEDFE